jgi:hypothetical protein
MLLASYVVELKHYWIALATIDARVGLQIL